LTFSCKTRGFCPNAHRGKVRKAIRVPIALEMLEEELPPPAYVFEQPAMVAAEESGEYE
jgi:hypothetical protein